MPTYLVERYLPGRDRAWLEAAAALRTPGRETDMPVPFHAAMRDDLRPHQADNERALLEQRARIALADEHRQRRHRRADRKRGSNGGMNVTPLRVACAIGLLLLILGAMASKASAMPGSWPHLTPSGAFAVRLTECPCSVAGGPPGGLPALRALRATGSNEVRSGGGQVVANGGLHGSGRHYSGHQIGQRAAIQPRATSSQPSETFDWADASAGAGATIIAALLMAAGALEFSRRRVRGHLTAESNR
jgi:hypothetical protein